MIIIKFIQVFIPLDIVYNGKTYSTLTHVKPDGTDSLCQNDYYELSPGYMLAPHDADSIAVIKAHSWSTNFVILSDGSAYYTSVHDTLNAGTLWSSDQLASEGNLYGVSMCDAQILQV